MGEDVVVFCDDRQIGVQRTPVALPPLASPQIRIRDSGHDKYTSEFLCVRVRRCTPIFLFFPRHICKCVRSLLHGMRFPSVCVIEFLSNRFIRRLFRNTSVYRFKKFKNYIEKLYNYRIRGIKDCLRLLFVKMEKWFRLFSFNITCNITNQTRLPQGFKLMPLDIWNYI